MFLPVILFFKLIYWIGIILCLCGKRQEQKQLEEQQQEEYLLEQDEPDGPEDPLEQDIETMCNMPDMLQIWPIDDHTSLGIQAIAYCPDKTAFIRIIGDFSYSDLIYKRRVKTNKESKEYILFNGKQYILKPNLYVMTPKEYDVFMGKM